MSRGWSLWAVWDVTDCSSCYSSTGVGKRMLWLAKLGCKWCSSVLHSFASNSHLAPARDCFVTACSSLGRHGTSQIWSTGDQPAGGSCQILNSQTAAQRRVSDERLGDCRLVCLDLTELWGANLRQEWQNNNYHSQGWLSTTDGAIFLWMFSSFFACKDRIRVPVKLGNSKKSDWLLKTKYGQLNEISKIEL